MGQSNMAGRGALPPPASLPPTPDILCFDYDTDRWGVATEPLHNDGPVRGGGGTVGGGIAWSFAHELLDRGLVAGRVGLVPCAFGGSPLSRWVKDREDDTLEGQDIPGNSDAAGGDLYARCARRARQALAAHPGAVLRGCL
jgi:hypothetical protein